MINDKYPDPKAFFVNQILVPLIKQAQNAIYIQDSPLHAVRPLKGLIDALDEKTQTQLEKERKQLGDIENNPKSTTREDMEGLFTRVMKTMHKRYLAEYFGEKSWVD